MEMSNYRAKSTKVTKIEETERRLKSDTKKLPEGTRKQKPVTNDIDKLKTRANETEYWKKYNDNNTTNNNKID